MSAFSTPLAADPLDATINPWAKVESATIVAPIVPGETAVELTFDVPVTLPDGGSIHAFGALKNPITTSTWTTPVLEDLNADGKPDLVVVDAMSVQVYLSTGALGFEGDPVTIATREVLDSTSVFPSTSMPIAHWDTAISFGDADNDGDRDLICGEKWHGNVIYFPMVDQAPVPGQLREFGPQRTLKYEANGQKSKIALATADYTTNFAQFPLPGFGHDMAMAAPALLKYDSDEFYDLVVADNIYGPQKHVIFWVFRYLGNDPANGGAPYYAEPIPLTINGIQAVVPESAELAVPTFVDVDGSHGVDLVVSTESGKIYVAANTGQSTGAGYPDFSPFVVLTAGGGIFDGGTSTAAIPTDADADGDLDLLVSTLTEEGPSRRLLRLFRSAAPGSLGTLKKPGFTIGSGNTLLPFAPSTQHFSNLQVGKFNHDKFPDLIQGLQNGQIAVSFSTDTGNDYDPVYASPILCRNSSGGVFDITSYNVPHYTPRVAVYDSDLDGHLEGLVLAVADRLYYCAHVCVDDDGCIVLADPVEITVPAGVFATSVSSYLSVAFGDFTPGVGPDSLDGAILFKESGFGINGVKGQEVYRLPLASLNPPQFGAATLLVPNTNDFTYPPAAPCLRDLNGDGDLDMITCPAAAFVWWENTSGPGPVTSMVKRQTVIDAGNAAVYASGAESFCIFDWEDPTDSRPLVISPSRKLIDPSLPVKTRLYHLNGINSSGNLLVERHPTRGLVQIEQTLASSVVQLSPTRFKISVPIELLAGDRISVNRILVNVDEVACKGITLDHWDRDGDGLPNEWELAHGTNPDFANAGGQFQDGPTTNLEAFLAGVQADQNATIEDHDGDSIPNDTDSTRTEKDEFVVVVDTDITEVFWFQEGESRSTSNSSESFSIDRLFLRHPEFGIYVPITFAFNYTGAYGTLQKASMRIEATEFSDITRNIKLIDILDNEYPSLLSEDPSVTTRSVVEFTISAGSISSQTIQFDPGVTDLTDTTPHLDSASYLERAEIVPDDGQSGKTGDQIPSINGANGEKHYVSPKITTEIDDEFVILKAKGVEPAIFEKIFEWECVPTGNGSVDPGNSAKFRVKRADASKSTVKLKAKEGGQVADLLNVWVVWSDIQTLPGQNYQFLTSSVEPLRSSFGGIGSDYANYWRFKFKITPAEIVAGNGNDKPDLRGDKHTRPPGHLVPHLVAFSNESGSYPSDWATLKWDVSRQIEFTIANVQLIPKNKFPNHTVYRDQPKSTSIRIPFPDKAVQGNDDPGTPTGSILDEDVNPYVALSHQIRVDLNHAVGELSSSDQPYWEFPNSMGVDGATFATVANFKEFARVNLLSNPKAAKDGEGWFRISDYQLWHYVISATYGEFPAESGKYRWGDAGSVTAKGRFEIPPTPPGP